MGRPWWFALALLAAVAWLAPGALAGTGGPGGGGYVYVDSQGSTVPVYSWASITSSGTNLALANEATANIFPTGFSFTFYGATKTAACATDNGLVAFGCANAPAATPVPTAAAPNDLLAAYWTDFDPSCVNNPAASNVWTRDDGTGSQRTLTVQWNNMPLFKEGACGTPRSTFQAKLYEGTDIVEFLFQSVTNVDTSSEVLGVGASVHDLTVGLEDAGGTSGMQYAHTTFGWVRSGLGVRFFVNDAADATAQAVSTTKDTAVAIPLTLSDDPKTITLSASPLGNLAGFPGAGIHYWQPGPVTYTPPTGWCGTDTFTYATDDGFNTDTATVTVTVTGCNVAPDAADDAITIAEDGSIAAGDLDVLDNDADPDGQPAPLSAVLDAGPTSASSFTLNADGTFTYVPDAGWWGTDSFTYKAYDGQDASAVATVTITVDPVLNAPDFDDAGDVSAAEDAGPVLVAGWASSPDDGEQGHGPAQTVTYELTVLTGGALLAAADLHDDGTLAFTPAAEAWGTVSLEARARDEASCTLPDVCLGPVHAFTITITSVLDAPTFAAGGDVTVDEDTPLATVWATSLDDGEGTYGPAQTVSIEVEVVSGGDLLEGAPTVDASGTLHAVPAAHANGPVGLRARAVDGPCALPDLCEGPWQEFTLTIEAVNDAPDFTDGGSVIRDEDAGTVTVAGWAAGLTPGGGADEEGQAVSVELTVTDGAQLLAGPPSVLPDGTLTFTTADHAVGTVTVGARARDTGACGAPHACLGPNHAFTIVLDPVNDPPTFTPGPDVQVAADATDKDLPWGTDASPGGGPDEAGQEVTWHVSVDDPGLFEVAPTIVAGDLRFRPGSAPGATQVHVFVEDGPGAVSPTQSFTLTLVLVNEPPTFTLVPAEVPEDAGPVSVPVMDALVLGPAWESGQAVQAISVEVDDASLFAVEPTLAPDGVLSFTPANNAFGTTVLTVQVQDDGGTEHGGADTGTGTTILTIQGVNDPPTWSGAPDVTVAEDSGATSVAAWIAVSAGPGETEPVTVTLQADEPSLFAVQPAVTAGTLTFTPAPDASGATAVAFTLDDGAATAHGAFTITVTSVNDVPVAAADVVDAWSDAGPLPVAVLANDADVEGPVHLVDASASWPAAYQPAHGTAWVAGGELLYEPTPGHRGNDAFVYVIADADGAEAAATVFLHVLPDPTAFDDAAATPEDTPATLFVRANDRGRLLDGGPAGNDDTIIEVTHGALGTVTTDGATVTYTPHAEVSGADTFTYTLAGGSTATVWITITAVEEAPVGADDAYSIWEDIGPVTLDVLANDHDAEGDPLHVTEATAAHGTVAAVPGGLRYTAPAGFYGTDTLSYRPHDGHAPGAPVTVTVTVADPTTPAAIIDDPGVVCAGTVTLHAHGHLYGEQPTSYAWDVGTGGTVTLTSSRDVTVTVTFTGGATATATRHIEVRGCIISAAAFTYTVTGQTVTFTDQSTGAASWLWDFGDGTGSHERHPTHTYAPGTYEVVLVVRSQHGNPATVTMQIHVPPAPQASATTVPPPPSLPPPTPPPTPVPPVPLVSTTPTFPPTPPVPPTPPAPATVVPPATDPPASPQATPLPPEPTATVPTAALALMGALLAALAAVALVWGLRL